MASASKLAQRQMYSNDANVIAGLSLPTTCIGIEIILLPDETKIYEAWGTGAPSTNYNNLSLGSKYTDLTNYKYYIMTAAATDRKSVV